MHTQNNILILEEDLNVLGVLNYLDALFTKVPDSEGVNPSQFFPSIYVSGNFTYVQICFIY
jgi:hypothetical protein